MKLILKEETLPDGSKAFDVVLGDISMPCPHMAAAIELIYELHLAILKHTGLNLEVKI